MRNPLEAILSFIVFIPTFMVSVNVGLSQTNITQKEYNKVMANQINQATSLLLDFSKSKSIDQLENALRAMEGVLPPRIDKTVQSTAARQEQTKMWLSLLGIIDQSIDPTYNNQNPKNAIAVNLAPPPTSDGISYPSGVDPKAIKDPVVRSQYEAALKQNNDKAIKAMTQTRLHHIDQLASLDVERFLQTFYTSSIEDKNELDNIMRQTKLSQDRVRKLKAPFHK